MREEMGNKADKETSKMKSGRETVVFVSCLAWRGSPWVLGFFEPKDQVTMKGERTEGKTAMRKQSIFEREIEQKEY